MQLAELTLRGAVPVPDVTPAPDTKRLVLDLFERPRSSRGTGLFGWALAFAVHALVAGVALHSHRAAALAERPPVELELTRPEPPPPPLSPAPDLPAPKATATAAPVARAPHPASAPPPAARPGALHTAKDDPAEPPKPDEPLDFTHDQSVQGFGGGVVAVGGNARFGAPGAGLAPAANVPVRTGVATPAADPVLDAADLGRKPSLAEADPCRGYFPAEASVDEGEASVLVVLAKSGSVSKATLLSESPRVQGFGAAARTCLSKKRFTPALDHEGRPAATAIRVNVRFTR
jgi:protein TonB